MKIQWTALFFTLALYVAGIGAFFLADKFDYRGGANDMDKSLLTFAFATLIVGVFFIRSLYQAIRIDFILAGRRPACGLYLPFHVFFYDLKPNPKTA